MSQEVARRARRIDELFGFSPSMSQEVARRARRIDELFGFSPVAAVSGFELDGFNFSNTRVSHRSRHQ